MELNIEKVKQLIDEGFSTTQLQNYFSLRRGQVKYFLRKNNLKTHGSSKIFDWSEENLKNCISISSNKTDILKNMGLKNHSGNFKTLDRYCKLYNIDLIFNKKKNFSYKGKLQNEIFCVNSLVSQTTMREHIKKNNLIKYECEKCENKGEWMGEKISLQLDHINGINNDHRLENLRYLCPNCHSQTSTYGSKRFKKKYYCKCGKEIGKKISLCFECKKNILKIKLNKEDLENLINKHSFREIGRMFGVSYKTVQSTAKKLGIML